LSAQTGARILFHCCLIFSHVHSSCVLSSSEAANNSSSFCSYSWYPR
jgi:hypothetical protein